MLREYLYATGLVRHITPKLANKKTAAKAISVFSILELIRLQGLGRVTMPG
jgi:hypothetical protein